MTDGQIKCLSGDSLRAEYWQAKRRYDTTMNGWATLAAITTELLARGMRP